MSAESDSDPAAAAAEPDSTQVAEADAEPGGIAADPQPPRSRLPRTLGLTAGAVVAVAAVVTAAVLAGGGHDADGADGKGGTATTAADGLPHTAVNVSTGSCGLGWTRPHPGTQVFDLHNSGSAASEVYLADPRSGKLYGELEGLAPGTTRQMLVDLGSGTYAFKCLQEDADAVTGPSVTVPGTQPQGPATVAVTEHDLIPPTLAYQQWISARMADLARGTAVLRTDIDRGDLTAAKRDWLAAHLVYERMGAAYGTFGDADGAINGTAARTPGAVHDSSFTGFHRVEYGLWHGEPASSLKAPAAQLDHDVRALRDSWSQARMDPADMGLRAHEIVENTEQFELTGRTDYGSGTNLATARANLDGTREILGRLRSLLTPRDPAVPQLDAALDRLQRALDATDHGGNWTPLNSLGQAQRERINADTGDLLEQLAPVAAIFDVRRTA